MYRSKPQLGNYQQKADKLFTVKRTSQTCQSHRDEQDDKFPLQWRSPDNRCISSNHVPNMSYGLLRNFRRNVKFATNNDFHQIRVTVPTAQQYNSIECTHSASVSLTSPLDSSDGR